MACLIVNVGSCFVSGVAKSARAVDPRSKALVKSLSGLLRALKIQCEPR